MIKSYKPEGYNSVSPYLIVKGAQKMIDLLNKIFRVRELRRYNNPDGSIMHAELRVEDTVIMLADANEKFPPVNHLLHVYIQDVNNTFKKAIDAGCELVEAPAQKEGDPDRRGMFRDFAGNTWAVGTQVNEK
jgi:PhnB protein